MLWGSKKRWHFSPSLRQQKGMPEQESSRGIGDKGLGKVSRANRLSSEPPQARPCEVAPQIPLQTAAPQSVSGRWGSTPALHAPTQPASAPAPAPWCPPWSGQLLGGARVVGWPGRAADGRPRGQEQSCQVMSCCLASFSRSFNVHSSRISESSQDQLSSDLLLHGGCYDHRGHLTSGSRPGFFWQSWMMHMLLHLNGNSDGSERPLPHPAF